MPKFVLSGASGLLVKGNIDIDARSFVAVPAGNGQFASVRSVSWHMSRDELMKREKLDRPQGAEVLVPTVIRRGSKWVIVHARGGLDHYLRTGRHLGIFDTPKNATAYANRLHLEQAAAAQKRRRARNRLPRGV